jgi:hypothetical protein
MGDAVQHGLLENAVALELQDVDPLTAADYLTRIQLDPAPRAWRDLIDRLRHMPDSPIAKALNSPLTLTLVRDTYRPGESVRELLDAVDRGSSPKDIEDHLLDRVLPAAYAPRPGEGPPTYQLEDAQRALRHIAVQMSQHGTRDLEWWRIPMWPPAPAPFRLIVTGLVIGPVCGLVIGLGVGLTCGLGFAGGLLAGGLAGGLVFGCGCAVTGLGGHSPTQLARWRWRQLLSRFTHVVGWARWLLVGGLAFGTLAGVAVGLFVRPGLGVGIALVSWVVIGLLVGLIGGFSQPASRGSASPLTPLASWRGDRVFGLVIGLVGGLVIGLALGLALEFGAGLNIRHGLTLVIWAVVGLTLGLAVGFIAAEAWPASLAFWQLARRWDTPVRLLQFLEDACKRDVLRTVGPVYQFRHSRLQDRLANPARTPARP